jgi:hypothetical protein
MQKLSETHFQFASGVLKSVCIGLIIHDDISEPCYKITGHQCEPIYKVTMLMKTVLLGYEFFLDILTLEDGETTFARSVGISLPSDLASYPRRTRSSAIPLQKP